MYEMTHATSLLIQAVGTLPDTIYTRAVPADVGVFQTIITTINGLFTLALLVLAVGFAVAAWNLRKTYRKVNDLLDRLYGDMAPMLRSAGAATDDAREIVAIVKGDVRQVQQTVAAANARLLKAVKQAEARLDEFNALIEVIQDEAESTFVNTASTARGVRSGLAQVFDSARSASRNDDDDDTDDNDNREEFDDGADRNGTSAGATRPNTTGGPRRSPRRRGGFA
jgi:uncharacterized protein YoxC